eukprot:UN22286
MAYSGRNAQIPYFTGQSSDFRFPICTKVSKNIVSDNTRTCLFPTLYQSRWLIVDKTLEIDSDFDKSIHFLHLRVPFFSKLAIEMAYSGRNA